MTISDPDRRASLALQVWGYKQGEVVSLMIYLGDQLGMYRAMAGQGPIRAAGLAARTGLHERWLLEWLRGQAAAGLVDTTDGEVFEFRVRRPRRSLPTRRRVCGSPPAPSREAWHHPTWWIVWPTPFVPAGG